MFRESDYVEPVHHPSYTKKPMASLQKMAENAKFDGERNRLATINDQMPAAIPATWDHVYDPSHRDADWAGMVPKDGARRRLEGVTAAKSSIYHTDEGLVSAEEQIQWPRKLKRDEPVNRRENEEPLIGGIGSDEHWRTNYQRFETNEPTKMDQMTLEKRTLPRKPLPNPAQVIRPPANDFGRGGGGYNSGPPSGRSGYNVPVQQDGGAAHISSAAGTAIFQSTNNDFGATKPAYRGGSATVNRSLLANIGQSLLTRVPEDDRALGGGMQVQQRSKTLILENYKPEPGYTGYRRR